MTAPQLAGLSRVGLGGHEFLPDGRSRGFNEDFRRATTPGVVWEGFGGDGRTAVVRAALEAGVTFFDATIDAEKEALGRNLAALAPAASVFVQTRPEGMCWTNNPADEWNWRLADRPQLEAEVRRLLGLLRRPRLDFLNFGFMGVSLERDPDFLKNVADNIARLKAEGLIRFATGDTFSGEAVYLRAIAQGCFDALFVNFNVANDGPARRVLPAAAAAGLTVLAREAYGKGELFRMGDEAGITDRARLAAAAVRWVARHSEVTTVVVGADRPEHITGAVAAARAPYAAEDEALLARVRATAAWRAYRDPRWREFTDTDPEPAA